MTIAKRATAMRSVTSLVSMNSKPEATSNIRWMMESLENRYPCKPADNAMTPIDAVVIARIVTRTGVPGTDPRSSTGLSRKKNGRMNAV